MDQAQTAGGSSRAYRRSPLRLGTSTVSLVFSLCVPYVASSPLPAPVDSAPSVHFRGTMSNPVAILRSLSSLARSSDFGASRDNRTDPNLVPPFISPEIVRPILAIAHPDSQGLYRVPHNFIILHQRFNPGFIVLSYAIAFVGSLCTLELLIRRTTNTGWRNRVLLTAAGCTFGAVSTFAMHFIFNNSLSLHHPLHPNQYPSLHLAYSPGYTVLSLVASCLAMTGAFFVMGTRLQDWWFLPWVKRRTSADKDIPATETKSPKSSIFSKNGDKPGYSKRRTYSVENILQQAGQVAKWSLVHPTPNTVSDDSKGWKKWRKESKEGKFTENRRSWAGYTAGESTEEFAKSDATRLDELPRSRTEPALELIESRHSEDAHVVESRQPADTSYFTPGYEFASPGSQGQDTSFVVETSPMSPRRLLPSPGQEQSPLSHIDTSVASGPSSPPMSPTATRPGYRPNFTLTRISSVPDGSNESNASTSRNSRGLRPPITPRTSSSPIGRRTSSLPHPLDFQDASSTKKQSYTKLETFFGLDVLNPVELIKLCITGIIAGTGVAGMHYIGQLSIIGIPYIAYKIPYVVGSVIIACGAVTVALYILFIMLRPKLKHTWLAKLAVAGILAVAVCGMHFCGMMGTVYAWRLHDTITTVALLSGTNRAITAIVACLAFAACFASAVFFVLQSLKLRRERARRRRVVVAAVMMDEYDRVLVNTTDGMLPMCDIASLTGGERRQPTSSKRSAKSGETITMESSSLGMDLTPGHEAFVNALKMSWAWRQSTAGDKEKEQVARQNLAPSGVSGGTVPSPVGDVRRGSISTTSSSALTILPKAVSLSAAKFLDKFASASHELSIIINGHATPLSRLGVLYDQILTTGWVKLNNSNDTVSKGQLIFLVRRVTSSMEQSALTTRQYIFADPQAVASTLEKTLSVPRDHAMPLLDDIRRFCHSTIRAVPQPGRLYAGVAIVQATPFDGLRLLLEQGNRAQLPLREICTIDPIASPAMASTTERRLDVDLDTPLSGTLEQLGEAITWLEGMSLMAIMSRNMTLSSEPPESPSDHLGGVRVTKLLQALERAIVPMLDDMLSPEDMYHVLPRLYLHPVLVPLTPDGPGYTPPYSVVFYANYDIAVNTFTDKWLPFTLYRAQNACVMAQSIANAQATGGRSVSTLATSIPPAGPTWIPGEIGSEEGIFARRPSKVQFELGPSTISPHTYHQPLPTPTSPILEDQEGIVKDYSFPPKAPNQRPPPLGLTRDRSPKSATIDLPTPTSATSPTFPSSANPLMSAGLPRKSSLASKSRFEEKEVFGVGDWDPDWLLVLLRTKLRADA